MAPETGLALFDAVLSRPEAVVVASRMDLDAAAKATPTPALLRNLLPTVRPVAASAAAPAGPDLVGLTEAEQADAVLNLVRAQVAEVLGHGSAGDVNPDRAFTEIGFDSLTGVELRNRLSEIGGVPLATTVVFDHPNPRALAGHLLTHLTVRGPDPLGELDRLAALMDASPGTARQRSAVVARLRQLARKWSGETEHDAVDPATATDEELFRALDSELSHPLTTTGDSAGQGTGEV
jgi:hypothetical protein